MQPKNAAMDVKKIFKEILIAVMSVYYIDYRLLYPDEETDDDKKTDEINDHRTEVRWFWVCRLIAGRAALINLIVCRTKRAGWFGYVYLDALHTFG